MFKATDPDAQIKARGRSDTTYPDTDYKATALAGRGQAYNRSGTTRRHRDGRKIV